MYKHMLLAACLLYGSSSCADLETDVTLMAIALGNEPLNGALIASLDRPEVVNNLPKKVQTKLYDAVATQEAIRNAKAAKSGGAGQAVLSAEDAEKLISRLELDQKSIQNAKTDQEILAAFKKMYEDKGAASELMKLIAPDGAAKVQSAVRELTLKNK